MLLSTMSLLSPHITKSLRVNTENKQYWVGATTQSLSLLHQAVDSYWISDSSLKLEVYKLASVLPEDSPFASLLAALWLLTNSSQWSSTNFPDEDGV